MNNLPNIRFEGFNYDWEEKKFGSFVSFFSGLTYSPDDVIDSEGTLVLRSSNVKNGEVIDADNVYVNDNKVNSDIVKKGDIVVVVRNGSRRLIGKHALIKYPMNNTVIGAFMTGIRSKNPYFINALLDSSQFKREIHKNLGATINQITSGNFKKMNFYIPSSVEQNKIGEFFKHIDENIYHNQHALELLKQRKKALLQKMFPKKGKNIPEIRFMNHRSEWKQYKFFEVIDKTIDFRGRTPKKIGYKWSNEGYLALSALNVKNGYIDYSVDAHYGNAELYNKWMKGNELRKNQVLFTTEAPMGNVAQVPDNQGYILSQRTLAFEVNKQKVTDDFLAVLLKTTRVYRDLLSLSSGGTAKGVSQKSLSFLKIMLPIDIDEQEKIGNLFKELENSIALQEEKLGSLKQMKKAFLQKMFI